MSKEGNLAHVQLLFVLDMPAHPRMVVGERGKRGLEVSLVLPLDQAQLVLWVVGKVVGVYYRLWASDGEGAYVATSRRCLKACSSTGPTRGHRAPHPATVCD